MNRFEKFTIETLQQAKVMGSYSLVHTLGLASQYGINERHIREGLLKLQEDEFIRLSAWDGSRDRPIDEWSSPDVFFDFTGEDGYKRIWLLIHGAEFLENLPQHNATPASRPRIGFTADIC